MLFKKTSPFTECIIPKNVSATLLITGGFLVSILVAYLISAGLEFRYLALFFGIPLGVVIFLYPFVGLLLFILMIPLESSFLSIGGGIGSYSRLLGIMILLVWVLHLLRERTKIKIDRSYQWGVLFLIWAGTSVLWAANQNIAMTSIIRLAQFLGLFLLIINEVNSRKKIWAVLYTLFGSCTLAAFLGYLGINRSTTSILLTLENQGAKEYATYIALPILMGIVIFVFGKTKKKWIVFILSLLLLYPFILSGERGVLVGLSAGLLGITLLGKRKVKLLIVLLLIVLIAYMSMELLSNFGLVDENLRGRFSLSSIIDTGGSGRLDIWAVGLELVKDNFLFGAGLDNFSVIYSRYIHLVDVRVISYSRDPHNDFLQVAGDLGIVGLFFWVGMIGTVFQNTIRTMKSDLDDEAFVLTALTFAIFVYLFSIGMTSTLMWRKVYWLAIGLNVSTFLYLYKHPTLRPE